MDQINCCSVPKDFRVGREYSSFSRSENYASHFALSNLPYIARTKSVFSKGGSMTKLFENELNRFVFCVCFFCVSISDLEKIGSSTVRLYLLIFVISTYHFLESILKPSKNSQRLKKFYIITVFCPTPNCFSRMHLSCSAVIKKNTLIWYGDKTYSGVW